MDFDPDRHHRRSIRLPGYDYSQAGVYFVTICARGKECLLGQMAGGAVRLSEAGQIAFDSWAWLGQHYPSVILDAFVVMPNHVHGILVLAKEEGGSRTAPTGKPLGRLVAAFKTVSTKAVNAAQDTPGVRLWQRNYYEHVIRDAGSLARIRGYIAANPRNWADDPENPAR